MPLIHVDLYKKYIYIYSHYCVPVAIIHLIGLDVKENKCHETMLVFVSSLRTSSPSSSGGVVTTAGGEEENKARL